MYLFPTLVQALQIYPWSEVFFVFLTNPQSRMKTKSWAACINYRRHPLRHIFIYIHCSGAGMQMERAMAHGAFMQGPMCPPMQPFNPDAGTPEDVLKKRTWHPISTSISCVLKVPKSQQIDGIVSIAPSLDSTLTGQCESDVLAVLVFMLTGIKANFPLSQLRVTYYEELWEKYAVAAKRTEEWYWSSESGSLCIQIHSDGSQIKCTQTLMLVSDLMLKNTFLSL